MKCFLNSRSGSFGTTAALILGALIGVATADAQTASRAGRQQAAAVDMTFEQEWSARATQAEADERWSDAADAWEVLGLARPQERDFAARVRGARERARERADELTRRGEDAVRRADVRRAMAYFLGALAALPSHAPAQRALRQLARRHPFDEPNGGGGRAGMRAAESPFRAPPPTKAGSR